VSSPTPHDGRSNDLGVILGECERRGVSNTSQGAGDQNDWVARWNSPSIGGDLIGPVERNLGSAGGHEKDFVLS
jgi:hypothetical protein